MEFVGTIFSLLPAVIAIGLALITKEVYLSLFIGIVSGALLITNFDLINTLHVIFESMIASLSDRSNIGILIFLVFLGFIVALMSKAGGSKAYGDFVRRKIKSRKGALGSVFMLGTLIFVDDYFNCLTVGSVMRNVCDKFNISRAKLAYVIDSTAAPVCIIAPISSWAAAVTGYTSGDGFALFLATIPLNIYALLTIVMVITLIVTGFDFGKMKSYEDKAIYENDLYGVEVNESESEEIKGNENGRVIDLVLPVLMLIISCITMMAYTGGFFDGIPFMDAFRSCDAPLSLVFGSFLTLLFMFALYLPRKVVSYREFTDCLPVGFKMMVSAVIILILAWTLGDMVSVSLEAGEFVTGMIESSNFSVKLIPAIVFMIAIGLAFATGTSWGTFSVLIPIVTSIFSDADPMLTISIAAILAGAVCGDHISPISDTTIMSSAGAGCNHIVHVETQIPYALVVAMASFVGYLVAGFTENVILTLLSGLLSLLMLLGVIFIITKKRKAQ